MPVTYDTINDGRITRAHTRSIRPEKCGYASQVLEFDIAAYVNKGAAKTIIENTKRKRFV